ncbi:MAG: hypothetical protein RI567_09540 [Marinobacter sp.]|nr:hypothetical protein [Marinobacter sp.]
MDLRVGLLCAAMLSAGILQAEMRLSETPLTDAELAQLRGGFLMDGLEIAIGLEQVVAINGDIQVINHLRIPNLNRQLNNEQLMQQMESVLVTQGAGPEGVRVASGAGGSGGWITVLQNSLNSATIQHIRQLDIELNNFGGAYRYPRDTGLPLLP